MRYLLILLCALSAPSFARAEEVNDAEVRYALEDLARCLVAEGPPSDWVAIAHVLVKRSQAVGVVPSEMARRYCSMFKVDTPRTRWLRQLKWDSLERPDSFPPQLWGRYKLQWQRACHVALLVAAGVLPDPCPTAWHFGSLQDGRPRRTDPVSCGATRSQFWSRPKGPRI